MNRAELDSQQVADYVTNQSILLSVAHDARSGASEPQALASALAALEMVQRRIQAREQEHAPAATRVFARLGLTPTEQHVVWILVAVALDPDVRTLLVQMTGERTADPSSDALRRIAHAGVPGLTSLHEMSSGGTLRQLGLIERSDTGGPDAHESRWTWTISRRLLAALHGDESLSPALMRLRPSSCAELPLSQLVLDPKVRDELAHAVHRRDAITIAVGPTGSGRRSALSAIVAAHGSRVVSIDARRLSSEPNECSKQLRAFALECKLASATPLLTNVDVLFDDHGRASPRGELIDSVLVRDMEGPILFTASESGALPQFSRPHVLVRLTMPSFEQRSAMWHTAVAGNVKVPAHVLAERFPFSPSLIFRDGAEASSRSRGPVTVEDIAEGVRAVLFGQIGAFAKRVELTQTWDDLVLSPEQTRATFDLMARVRRSGTVYDTWGFGAKVGRGMGVIGQFTGPPGTGKTTLAAVIARELGMDLYQVDMSKVTSKWIGETEKNLGALFDAAESGHAILLFDEGDGLFAKRSSVKTSNDRHANQETNFLLQRLESFRGIAFITSNHATNFDPAFQRRVTAHIRLDMPEAPERAAIWQTLLPANAPVRGPIAFDSLGARFAMTGGYIKNAVLRAAFLAADNNCAIEHSLLEHAAEEEWESMGHLRCPR